MVARTPTLVEAPTTAMPATTPLHRILGTLGMLGSPFLFLSFASAGFDPAGGNRLGSFFGLLFALGWYGNVLGLWTLRAAGTRFGRIPLAFGLVGVPLAIACQIYELIDPGASSVLYMIVDSFWPLSMLSLLITGIVVATIGVFRGPARFAPLFCGLWLPISIVLMGAVGPTVGQVYGGLHVMVAWFLLGLVIRNGGRVK